MGRLYWSWGEAYATPELRNAAQAERNQSIALHMVDKASPNTFSGAHVLQQSNYPFQHNATQSSMAQRFPPNQHKTSRKRSRDEMIQGYDAQDSDSSNSSVAPFPSARPTPSPPKRAGLPQQEAVMGPGMTLIYPDENGNPTGAHVDAASQTGFWAEELSERLRSSSMRDTQRPPLESRKSLRLDREAAEQMDDVASAAVATDPRVKVGFGSESSHGANGPTIDEASYALGVGWSCIPVNSTMDAATRGWSRHIEARFPLQNVRFVWMNRSLPAYLVSAVNCDGRRPSGSPTMQNGQDGQQPSWSDRAYSLGYYIFDESLSQGRLVSKNWDRALENLRSSPMVFDGDKTLESAESANQAQRDTIVPAVFSLPDSLPDAGVATDIMADSEMDHVGKSKVPAAPMEAKYWAGWGKPSVSLLYPQPSINSCSTFEKDHQSHLTPMIEVGGASAGVGGSDGMDLDF